MLVGPSRCAPSAGGSRHETFFEEIRLHDVFQRLGIFGDWAHPYLTMDPAYEAEEVRVLGRCVANGQLPRRLNNTICLAPPLISTEEQLSRLVDVLGSAIQTESQTS